MTEYGIFNDEGLVEGGFFERSEAEKRLSAYSPDDGCEVHEICLDHEGQPRHGCAECDGEEEDAGDA